MTQLIYSHVRLGKLLQHFRTHLDRILCCELLFEGCCKFSCEIAAPLQPLTDRVDDSRMIEGLQMLVIVCEKTDGQRIEYHMRIVDGCAVTAVEFGSSFDLKGSVSDCPNHVTGFQNNFRPTVSPLSCAKLIQSLRLDISF